MVIKTAGDTLYLEVSSLSLVLSDTDRDIVFVRPQMRPLERYVRDIRH